MEENKEVLKVDSIMSEPMEYGKVFAESGIFPDVKSAAQGAIKVLAGKEVGLSPLQSLNSFYFVNGRMGMAAQTMGALIKKSGKYDYQILAHTPEICTIAFFSINGERVKIGESTFDKKMAAASGAINKENWKNYPMNMMYARALANGARWFCPDAISGFYLIEELQDLEPVKKEVTIDVEGEVKTNGEA
jgi:hypothetical protein